MDVKEAKPDFGKQSEHKENGTAAKNMLPKQEDFRYASPLLQNTAVTHAEQLSRTPGCRPLCAETPS